MCDKTMENYKPNMFQLQCLKALEIQIEEGKGYNEDYKMIESDLYHYFASIGINEQQQRQAVTGVFDTADIDTIQKLCQKEKMHLRYESIGKNESKEITKLTYEQLCNSLKKGIYQVAFSIYRQGKDWKTSISAFKGG